MRFSDIKSSCSMLTFSIQSSAEQLSNLIDSFRNSHLCIRHVHIPHTTWNPSSIELTRLAGFLVMNESDVIFERSIECRG